MGGWTHGVYDVCCIHVRRGNLLAPLVSSIHLRHIPDTGICVAKLRPDIALAFGLVRLVAIWVALEFVNEGVREINLLRVRHG